MLRDEAATEPMVPPARRRPEGAAPGLVQAVLAGLDDGGVRWCLLRGPNDNRAPTGDVDILVERAQLSLAAQIMRAHGLVRLPSYGRGTHVFYLGLDPSTCSFVEFDLVTEMAYGRHFELRADAAGQCLERRQRRHGAWKLALEDEFWALLLHVLLDKNAFADRHARQLRNLRHAASLDSPLARAMPRALSATLLELAQASNWSSLMMRRWAVRAALWRAHPVAATSASVGSAAVRLVERPLQAWRRRGISVALLGPDGAGKSTLAEGIASAYYFPVRRVYLGLWPSDATASGAAGQAVRVIMRPLIVLRRYSCSLLHRARGRLVVFDRYVYDALLPPRGSFVRLKRVYFLLLSRLCPAPHVVLLLDAPGRVMHARSNEYDPEHLEEERRQYRLLSTYIPHVQHLDADRPPEVVLDDAIGQIWQHYVGRAVR